MDLTINIVMCSIVIKYTVVKLLQKSVVKIREQIIGIMAMKGSIHCCEGALENALQPQL